MTSELSDGRTDTDKDSFDTDLEDGLLTNRNGTNTKQRSTQTIHPDVQANSTIYELACETLGVTPHRSITQQLVTSSLRLSHMNLGDQGVEALAMGLKENQSVELLELSENAIGTTGILHLVDVLINNHHVTHLDLSMNDLGSAGAHAIYSLLLQNNIVKYLGLSGVNFEDRDAELIADGIYQNDSLTTLDLSRNGFCEYGVYFLGKAMGENNSIEHLDLSWNAIRRAGAVSLCQGLQRNYCLTTLNVAWNGFGYEGALAVSQLLKYNRYIRELDLSNNRITWKGAALIASSLKENDSLEVLKLGHNPMMTTGCLDLLEAANTKSSALSYLGLQGIDINNHIIFTVENIQRSRSFTMDAGRVSDFDDVIGRKEVVQRDPIKVLIAFLNERCIRPVDLFRTFAKDDSNRVTRKQFIDGLKKSHVPLSNYEIDQVVATMRPDGKGRVSYQVLVEGVRQKIRAEREEVKRRKAQKQRLRNDHQRIMDSALPLIGSGSSTPLPLAPTRLSVTRAHTPASLLGMRSPLASTLLSTGEKSASSSTLFTQRTRTNLVMSAPLGSQLSTPKDKKRRKRKTRGRKK